MRNPIRSTVTPQQAEECLAQAWAYWTALPDPPEVARKHSHPADRAKNPIPLDRDPR